MTTQRRYIRPLLMTFIALQTAVISACCMSPSDFRMSNIMGKPTLPNYQKDCLAKSRLDHPTAVGEIINTPHYALITLQRSGQNIKAGEMCIINKTTHTIEITAIDDLQFLSLPSDAK
jgi:hypothetical protein